MEEWRDVVGYENFYEASTYGNIRSKDRLVNRKNGNYIKRGVLLRCAGRPYKMRALVGSSGNYKKETVHRVIAKTFIPNPHNLPCINHINGIKTDNRVENLEWCTYSHNLRHALKSGLKKAKSGEDSHSSKLSDKDILDIFRMCSEGMYVDDMATHFKISKAHISRILRGVSSDSGNKSIPVRESILKFKSQEDRKFSREEVLIFMEEYHRNNMRPKDIQIKYGVTSGTLFDILKGRTYKYYTGDYLKNK